MSALDLTRAQVFGRCAEEYARWRPAYPPDAVEWLAPKAPARVIDLGAGTGQLTGQLLERGLRVEAVDPDARMLAVLRRLHPGASASVATAQAMPVAESSVDAVLAADAWHWFPFDVTVAEVRRVLKRGGWLGLVWNNVKPQEPWEYELAGIDPDRKGVDDAQWPRFPFPVSETEVVAYPWTWHATPEDFRGHLSTNSAVILMDPPERARRLDAAQRLLDKVCRDSGRNTVALHHEAHCVRWSPGGQATV